RGRSRTRQDIQRTLHVRGKLLDGLRIAQSRRENTIRACIAEGQQTLHRVLVPRFRLADLIQINVSARVQYERYTRFQGCFADGVNLLQLQWQVYEWMRGIARAVL